MIFSIFYTASIKSQYLIATLLNLHRISDFAAILSKKMGVSQAAMNKTLWGDFYLNSKTKKIMKGAQVYL